jgi:adenosylcobinamide-GDP ribazoletransferase
MVKGLVTALRTLSILPVPGKGAQEMASSLPWFAVAGCILGLILYGVVLLADLAMAGGWPQGTAAAVLVGGVLLTRGLHLDGLADCADGFYGAWDRERALAIMKDPHVGTFGVCALVLVLLARWVALVRLAASGLAFWIVGAYIVSRVAMVELAVWLPYARAEGGTGAAFVQGARPAHALWALASAGALLVGALGSAGAAALAAGWLIAFLCGLYAKRRIGGVTGDVLGACSEIVETAVLLLAAAFAVRMPGWGGFFHAAV